MQEDDIDKIVKDILKEVNQVSEKVGPYHSVHEGYAVMLEEFDELWYEVKQKDKNFTKMYDEAKHVACTAIRFMESVQKKKHENNIL